MEREMLKLSVKEAHFIVVDELDPNFTIIEDFIEDDENPYNEFHEIVIQRLSDRKFFKTFYNLERDGRYGKVLYDSAYSDETEVIMNEVFETQKTIFT